MRSCLKRRESARAVSLRWEGLALAWRRILGLMLTCRRKIELTNSGLSPQQGKVHPSIDPNVILVPMRERVKIEWRLVPCVICVEHPRLMHDFQSCFFETPLRP